MLEDSIARLYQVPPAEFTDLRIELAAEAKRNGDALAAKQIAALRKPSIAAWVVNVLVYAEDDATQRLAQMGAQLREAHATLDPDLIRQLSSERRKLVDELARAAFQATGLAHPPAALRDDVTGTLHAAIADPAVNERLGRLSKAEKWSGFGDVVATAAPVLRVVPGGRTAAAPTPPDGASAVADARRDMQNAVATVAAAERAKLDADDELDERQAEFTAARMKRDEARRRLEESERRLESATTQLERAKGEARQADDLLKAAKAAQRKTRDALESARKR